MIWIMCACVYRAEKFQPPVMLLVSIIALMEKFVKGVDSWASLSLMTIQEDIEGDGAGYLPRPTDQRFNFKHFLPGLSTWGSHFQSQSYSCIWQRIAIWSASGRATRIVSSDFLLTAEWILVLAKYSRLKARPMIPNFSMHSEACG